MIKGSDGVKEFLLRENEEFQQLASQHRVLDQRLSTLTEKFILSEEEKFEETRLKKQKLSLKDKMADLVRKHQTKEPTRAAGAGPAPA